MNDADLTRLVAEKVMGWSLQTDPNQVMTEGQFRLSGAGIYASGHGWWSPLTQDAHALMLVRKLALTHCVMLDWDPSGDYWTAEFHTGSPDACRIPSISSIIDKELRRAIVLAALGAADGVQRKEEEKSNDVP